MTGPAGGSVVQAGQTAGDRIWTERAAAYGWNTEATLASRLKVELVEKYLSSQSRVCDIGCGNGLFLRVLAPHCAHVTGIDLNADMLTEARAMLARENIGNVELLQCGADALPLPDSSVDLVYCFSTLLLIPNVGAALAEMVRVLSPGGYLILDVAGRNNLSAPYWWLWYRRHGHFGIRTFSYPAIGKALDALQCRIIEEHALGFCDQWKYVPGLHLAKSLEKVFHATTDRDGNLDYRITNVPGLSRFASRWYLVAQKDGPP
jgi:ubiquinone/menaquinone biosynthesis C-methylase UbiE